MLDKLLKKLLNNDELNTKIEHYRNIFRKIQTLRKQQDNLYKQYLKDKNEITLLINQERQKCDHPISTYHPDASGGNDSERICDICDASI